MNLNGIVKPEEADIVELKQVPLTQKKSRKAENGVIVDGVEGCQVKFAKCCNPLPGDPIVGFVTKGFGISIHRTDCKNVIKNMSRQRIRSGINLRTGKRRRSRRRILSLKQCCRSVRFRA